MITIDLRKVGIVVLLLMAALFLMELPDLQRYLRLRSM